MKTEHDIPRKILQVGLFFLLGNFVLRSQISLVSASTRWVPEDYKTIQDGIDAAQSGDFVSIANGIYTGPKNTNLDLRGKDITVHSRSGRENCIIDCEDQARGFYFHSGEMIHSVVEGLTIRRGKGFEDGEHWYAGGGGGIYCKNSRPLIADCIITECCSTGTEQDFGGGISCFRAKATIRDCSIYGNIAGALGGGIFIFEGRPHIENTHISGNHSHGGGGIESISSNPLIKRCSITENTIGPSEEVLYGAGIEIFTGSIDIMNSIIQKNRILTYRSYWAYGAGICGETCDMAQISNCTISENEIPANPGLPERAQGGGIAILFDSSSIITNCLITDNYLKGDLTHGGGIITDFADTSVINCTVADNQMTSAGVGGIFIHGISDIVSVCNCIAWGNTGDDVFDNMGGASITYCDVEGTFPGEGNICLPPCFIEGTFGTYYLSQIEAGQSGDSPCVNSGNTAASEICFNESSIEICLDQLTTRSDHIVDDGTVDMGFHYPIESITPTVTPTWPAYPTPTPTPSSYPTCSPTVTPTACTELGCTIRMPAHEYRSGDECSCLVAICNPETITYENVPFFVLIDVWDQLFFIDASVIDVGYGETERTIFTSFEWPDNAGHGSAIIYAAMTDQFVTELLGGFDDFDIRW